MEEVQGQAAMQPTVEDMAAEAARGLLQEEEGQPRDESGRFTKAQPEAEAGDKPEEAQQTEEPQEEQPQEEPDWERLKSLKRKLKVKAEDGSDEEVELTLEEMEKGVMLERSYRQKTAQIAREREALQAKIKEAVEPRLKEYETQLEALRLTTFKLADQEAMTADLNKLAMEDPARAQQLFFKRMEINQTLQAVAQEQHRLQAQRQEEMKAVLQRQAVESVERLKDKFPDWNNDLYGKILKAGVELYGFNKQEVEAITDHRAIEALHDAMQYRALKSAKPTVEKRQAPQAPKVVKPGAGEKPDAGADKWKDGMAKLKQSGRTEDAVVLARMMLEREAKQK